MQLIGQESNKDIINNWNKLPQFLIIQGSKHTGKTYLIIQICKKFGLNYVAMKNGIKDIRNLINLMTPDSNTVYHFKDFDKASIQAKNALLKITEEPIAGNYIIITGNSQIPTLESRAKKLVMQAYSFNDVQKSLEKYFDNPKLQEKLYQAGINTPAKVEIYHNYDGLEELINYAFTVFNRLTYITPDVCASVVSSFNSKYDGIDSVVLFISFIINIIEYNITNVGVYDYYDILKEFILAKSMLERDKTLNRKMAIFRLMYRIQVLGERNNEKTRGFKS